MPAIAWARRWRPAPPPRASRAGQPLQLRGAAELPGVAGRLERARRQQLGDRAQAAVGIGQPARRTPKRAARKTPSSRTSAGGSGSGPASAAWRARQCVERDQAAVSSSEACASSARISTVPSRGCGRSFHQNQV